MKPSVLLVDDSLTIRMDLKEAFEAAEFRTIECATLEQAWSALAKEAIDLVVLDVLLPDGDGVAFLEQLRSGSLHPEVPVILLSSETEIRNRVRGLKTGANEYVGKPYDRGYLVARGRELIGPSHSRAHRGHPLVLVIDDSPTFRDALQSTLTEGNYRVLLAGDGEEGLRMAAAHHPDLVVVDGVLPGADGATVVRRMRLDAALRQTPCLLLTGSDEPSAELKAFEAGADAFLRKGEDFSLLHARLGALLRSHDPDELRQARVSLSAPKKILAIHQDADFLGQLSAELRGEGYDVVCARTGEEALQLLALQRVDCILLDLLGPGLGGLELCRTIKAAPAIGSIPLLLIPSDEDASRMVEGLAAGADDFIARSSGWGLLKARLLAQLRRRQLEDENRRAREQLVALEREAVAARAAEELAATRAELNAQLQLKNRELEAFSYSVSHDLRAPLRAVEGFSRAALEACGEPDSRTAKHLQRVLAASSRMGELIEDLLELSNVGRAPLSKERLDLSALACDVAGALARANPERRVTCTVEESLVANADARLLRIVLENLLGNAWKFTSRKPEAQITVGAAKEKGASVFFVRDDGDGFDPAYAERLFAPFQRLHDESDFPGTGIGLATVHRILERHGGRVWAEAKPGAGATFFIELPSMDRRQRPA